MTDPTTGPRTLTVHWPDAHGTLTDHADGRSP